MRQVCFSLHPPLHAAHELASLFIRGFLQSLFISSSISVNFTEQDVICSFPTQHKEVTLEVVFLDFKYKTSHISPSSSAVYFIGHKASILQVTLKCLLLCSLIPWLICISFFKEFTPVLIHTIQVAPFIPVLAASHDICKKIMSACAKFAKTCF